ncbi:hypothetical protein AGMMS49545_03770 [Betaproteobacteria bacterium]|nr:hypothetical protein AGMMS49545_03770 [Betaproteobacteria bacterium]GHU41766.1 hypothetical protein AGMMS50289_05450 [Betaproteobacteria bacterium]
MESLLIDANVLISLFSKKTEERDRFRIQGLFQDAAKNKEKILLPAPALAEFAAHASGEEMALVGSDAFRIAPFDAKAAYECAVFLQKWAKTTKQPRQKVRAKFDFQILAIAKTNAVALLVTDDRQLLRQAKAEGIMAKLVSELPIPDHFRQRPLL